MEIIWAIIIMVCIIAGVIAYGAYEFGLNRTECIIVAIGGLALAIMSFWW